MRPRDGRQRRRRPRVAREGRALGRSPRLWQKVRNSIEYDGEPHGVFATQTERLTNDLLAFLSGSATRGAFNLDAVAKDDRQEVIDVMTAESIAIQPL